MTADVRVRQTDRDELGWSARANDGEGHLVARTALIRVPEIPAVYRHESGLES